MDMQITEFEDASCLWIDSEEAAFPLNNIKLTIASDSCFHRVLEAFYE